MRTAASIELSATHSTAVLNGICGLLDQCSTSSNPILHAIPFTIQSWEGAFQVFITSLDNYKTKPLKRLLLTLTNLILKHPTEEVKFTLIGHAICCATKAIRNQDASFSVKASIQLLEHFLSRGIVDAYEIVSIRTSQEFKESRMDLAAWSSDVSERGDTVEEFVLSILDWVQYPDCAPAVGRLLATLFDSLRGDQNQKARHGVLSGATPSWISPVKMSLARHQGLLEIYESHILPGLLRLSNQNRESFLNTLPLIDIQKGNLGKQAVADILLCLLVARIEANSTNSSCLESSRGDDREAEDHRPTKGAQKLKSLTESQQLMNIDIMKLGISLLDHSSPAVRIAALSLLISFANTAHRLSKQYIEVLQQSLPYFHVEANPKVRNEFIALMKKMYTKLDSAIHIITRDNQISSNVVSTNYSKSCSQDSVLDEREDSGTTTTLEEHLAFRTWYMHLLVCELRPTSSYQSHITVLKILHPFLEGDLRVRANVARLNSQHDKVLGEDFRRESLLRPLLDLLFDPFDDVREAADSLIQRHFSSYRSPVLPKVVKEQSSVIGNDKNKILTALQRAESKAAETGRADHADGVGRLYNILYGLSGPSIDTHIWHDDAAAIFEHLISKTEDDVELAQQDLLRAVSIAQLHGHLIALR